MSSQFVDPYMDPHHNVLRNKVGATSYDALRNAEGELVALRISEFFAALPISVQGTLGDLKFLHETLFQDIYDWAGQIRTVEIRKASEGSQFFLPSSNIEMGTAWARDELVKDGMLKGMPPELFAERLAYHYDNYNFIHPFREGNGRTQRLMWTLLCHGAGYDLHWQDVTGEENDEACRLAAEEGVLGPLASMFLRISSPCDPEQPINDELLREIRLEEKSSRRAR